ncbi:hypothetical protein BDW75DRAFT_215109 [Aspergillus navahoensis]
MLYVISSSAAFFLLANHPLADTSSGHKQPTQFLLAVESLSHAFSGRLRVVHGRSPFLTFIGLSQRSKGLSGDTGYMRKPQIFVSAAQRLIL